MSLSESEYKAAAFEKRLAHLITCGAYTKANLGFPVQPNRGITHYVRGFLKRFIEEHDQRKKIYRTETKYLSLKHQVMISKGHKSQNWTAERLAQLHFFESYEHPLEIIDRQGVVLGYRFRLPPHLITALEESEAILPVIKATKQTRGSYLVRHYAHWADFSDKVFESSDYQKQKEAADRWLEANKPLFQHLSNFLRIYNPEMWVGMTKSSFNASDGHLLGLARPWHGIAIGQGMGSEGGKDHQDWQDRMSVFNAVVPFGATGWKGAEVVLWQLGIKVAVERGDCFMFKGAIIAHKACAITEGQRNFIDLFCHKSVYDVQNRVKEEAGQAKSTDIRKRAPSKPNLDTGKKSNSKEIAQEAGVKKEGED
ncbi:hypothetical protein B9Z19DRAFT_1062372 [Tuber borchii]|uniref:Uncharacterized protein n=1 Tax=Tuber borchii TaxID=42251 RepID=A0A2T7A237_TUBBO|nr:hypothetical protein B9Z19DRAFT_1062372 [Tuber borchii]